MEKCDFGELLGDFCHKKHFTTQFGIKRLDDFSADEKWVLIQRAGIKMENAPSKSLKICYHHEWKFGTAFEKRFKNFCDLFKNHKNKVKGGHKISLELAKMLVAVGIDCVPGTQLCRSCYDKATTYAETDQEEGQ